MSNTGLTGLQPIHWVDDALVLQQLCAQWSDLKMIAIDTEFMRTNTYYPISALIQVNDGQANYLIDPVAIKDLTPFTALLQNPAVQKILHSCSEDLEVFNHSLKCLPVNLFDTQVAAAFCGHGFTIGYAGLVLAILGIDVPKGETRSDWLQRPLTDAQTRYAALDVEYLFQIASVLQNQLTGTDKESWVSDECLMLLTSYLETQDTANAIHRFKGAWRLNEQSLAVLKLLSCWREEVAQERNIPRNYVVKEKALYQIAEKLPAQLAQFTKIEEFSEKSIRRYGDVILAMVKTVKESEEQLPVRLPRPLTGPQKSLVKRLRDQVQSVAKSLNIAPEYLARKKDYEFIARAVADGAEGDDVFPTTFVGWKAPLIKPSLLSLI